MSKTISIERVEEILETGDAKDVLVYIAGIAGKKLIINTMHTPLKDSQGEFVYYSSLPEMRVVVEAKPLVNTIIVAGYGTSYNSSLAYLCHALLTPKKSLGGHVSNNPNARQFLVVDTDYGPDKIEIIGEPKRSWLNGPQIDKLGLT